MHNQSEDIHIPRHPGPIVLASTSRYRRRLFERLCIPFEPIDPGVDEEPYKRLGLPPAELVRKLAEVKARAAATHRPQALIVGGDQCATLDGKVLGKPGTVERTIEQLTALSGRTHELVTAICVVDAKRGHAETIVDVHQMTMRTLDAAQIRHYVQVDRPVDCAGSYKIEALGVALFERIDGRDPTAIVGVPLMHLVMMLARCGYDVFEHAHQAREG